MSLSEIKPEDLQNTSQLPYYEQELEDALRHGRTSEVLDFRLAVKKFLEVYTDLEYQNPSLFVRLRAIKLRIELEYFQLMTDEVQSNLLSNHIHDFQAMQIDLESKAQDLVQLTDPWLYGELRELALNSLLNNNEMVGSQQIELGGKLVAPTIGHWVALYREQDHSRTEAAMARLDFLNHGPARVLTDADRAVLAQVLDICDTFSTLTPLEEETPQDPVAAAPQRPAPEPVRKNPLYIPEKKPLVPMDQLRGRAATPSAPAAAATPQATQPVKNVEGMVTPRSPYLQYNPPAYPDVQPIVHAQPAIEPAAAPIRPYHPAPTSSESNAMTFTSLADLEWVDKNTILHTAPNFNTFVSGVKKEIEKVYARSPESRAHLVQLWRKSPLYKLYIEMGEQSMDSRTPIQQIADQRAEQGLPTLTKEEFDAVADLSRFIQ